MKKKEREAVFVAIWAVVFAVFLIFIAGYATTQPRNEREAFPSRNQNPQAGIIINQGTAHLNLFVYDQANRLIEQTYVPGANRYLTIDGQRIQKYWIRELGIGAYRVEIYPFYYKTDIVNAILGRPVRYRIDLPKQTAYIVVDRNPTYYYDYATARHWAWILRLNSGNIPDTAHGLPGINIDLQGEAWNLLFKK